MKQLIFFLFWGAFCLTGVQAQHKAPYQGSIRIHFSEEEQQKDTVFLQARVDLRELHLPGQSLWTLTPSIRSLDGSCEYEFEPFQVAGKKRYNFLRRERYFRLKNPKRTLDSLPVGKTDATTHWEVRIPVLFEDWMLQSRMVLTERVRGCGQCCELFEDCMPFRSHEGPAFFFPEPYEPEFRILYLPAPVGEKKRIRETHSAHLSFRVNQTNLIRQFGNNQAVLAQVDEILNRIRKDTLVSLKEITVTGYASPEGNADQNQRLSEGRAQALVDYLFSQYDFLRAGCTIRATGGGEDWAGLYKAVEERGSVPDRERVLSLIQDVFSVEQRKNALKSLSGGRTYRLLLEELYPQLRRNEYTLELEVRGFTAEEAREIFLSRPGLLSLEELFLVADLMQQDADQFKKVFEVAVNLYPDSEVAQFNVGAMEIEIGLYDRAIQRFESIGTPEAWCNMGLAYWYKKDYEQARVYLERAAEQGHEGAVYNLAEFRRFF